MTPFEALCRDCLRRQPRPADRRCAACGSPRLIIHDELERLTIAHLDCDAFYASVEKRDRPELADRPVIVGGGVRGVVSTCCYIARTYGVRSAMPMFRALNACPDAVVLRPDFSRYKAESRRIMAKIEALTPLVQPLSLDEAWIDLTGSERLNGGPAAFQLARLQKEIESEIGITVSIGLAPNKVLAKIASDLDKPRGFAVIGEKEARSFLAPRPVGLLPGVGPAMVKSLEKDGLRRIGDIAVRGPRPMADRYGAFGVRLYELSIGTDTRKVDPNEARKSISAENTFNIDLKRLDALEAELWRTCEKTARAARKYGLVGRVATLKLNTADFQSISRRRTLPYPTQTAALLFQATREMLAPEVDGRAFRLIGAGLSDLAETGEAPLDLFAADEARARAKESAMDALRARFGEGAIMAGRSLKPDKN